jgi:SAM-dependent methyltransferase
MKYQPSKDAIPQNKRESINAKILSIIDSGKLPGGITADDIYNGYTGVGGLHGLSRADYENYYEFSEDKKEIEQGQFFTPGGIVEEIAQLLQVQESETICDPACGAGAFFNSFRDHQCYGADIDLKAVKVAKFLYPEAHIDIKDLRYFEPDVKFDYVIGNPPFNLRWDYKDGESYPSQLVYFMKAAELLKPGGIICCIVPDNFLRDTFADKSKVETIDDKFNFLFQYPLDVKAFQPMGVAKYETKVVCFQRKAKSLEDKKYVPTYVDHEGAMALMIAVREERKAIRAKLLAEQALMYAHEHLFQEKMKKYVYEIKTHAILRPHLPRALAHIDKLYTQKRPNEMKPEEWEKVKLTPNKVLSYLRDIMAKQSYKPKDEIRIVHNKHQIWKKAYSDKMQAFLNKSTERKHWNMYEFMCTPAHSALAVPNNFPKGLVKLLHRKEKQIIRQTEPFEEMKRDEKIDTYLSRFLFLNPKGFKCKLNDIQKEDLGVILQKDYGILNWQQGSGKTAGATAWLAFNKNMRNTFIVGPALAINSTWQKHMTVHNKEYINIRSYKDVQRLRPGVFVLIGLEMLVIYERHIKKYLKMQGYKINFIFDESDEITNFAAKRTRATLNCFRRAKRKLLTTGTTTRNNINEIYPQLELIYNNSANMMCWVRSIWKETDEGLKECTNDYWGCPFPPFYGQLLFKRCFNPSKSTVFGIQKHNQDLYNEEELREILSYTVRTRKFKEIAGDKFKVYHETVDQNEGEIEVYRRIIEELHEIIPKYFNNTGNSRKEAGLRLIRQLQLLIKATSMPQYMPGYYGDGNPSKADWVKEKLEQWNEKVAIGCTSIEGVTYYTEKIRTWFPGRAVFTVVGDVSFKNRDKISDFFQHTDNGILVCTQQSLKSSVNIPKCDKVIIESKQWNIPKMEQFYFRFIRYDSQNITNVYFVSYADTIEMNLMALLLSKERLNDFIKTFEYRENSDIYEEFGVELDILKSILTRDTDSEGKMQISWGKAKVV